MRKCLKCGDDHPESEFYSGYKLCKGCHGAKVKEWRQKNREKVRKAMSAWGKANAGKRHRYMLRNRYGITEEVVAAAFKEQNGCCANAECRKPFLDGRFAVDHKHVPGYDQMTTEEKSKFFRGLLCNRCNTVLGVVEKNGKVVEGVLAYRDQHQNNSNDDATKLIQFPGGQR